MGDASGAGASAPQEISVLFVCLGNICRSPMGHAVLESMVSSLPESAPKVTVDSAGTGAYHISSPPDPRTLQTLKANGISGFKHKARMVEGTDFKDFDYILAMDDENLEDLQYLEKHPKRTAKGRNLGKTAKVMLFGEFGGRGKEVIGDPYYGDGSEGFEIAYEQCVRMSKGFLKQALGTEVDSLG